MAGVSGTTRVAVWVAAVVAGAVAIVLIGVAVLVDLDTANKIASIAGAVVALVGLVTSVVTLAHSSRGGVSGGSGAGPVDAGRGGIAAGGDMIGNAFGERSEVTVRLADDIRTRRDGSADGDDSQRR